MKECKKKEDLDPQGDEDNFEKWLELLEERGQLPQWSKEQHLCQLRTHLMKTAQQVFHLFTEEEGLSENDESQSVLEQ